MDWHNTSGAASFTWRKNQESSWVDLLKDFFDKCNIKFQDVTEDSAYFDKDIDFILEEWESKLNIELKVDNWISKTGNFFFEILSNERKSSKWCFLLSEADLFFYLDSEKFICYVFPLEKIQELFFLIRDGYLKKWNIKQFDKDFKLHSTHTVNYNNWEKNYQHTTIGRTVNKDFFEKAMTKYEIKFRKIDIKNNVVTYQDLLDLTK